MTAYELLLQTASLYKQAAAEEFPHLSSWLEKKAAKKKLVKKIKEKKKKEENKTDWGRIAAITLGALGTGAGGYALYQALKNKGGIENLNNRATTLEDGINAVNDKTKLNTALLSGSGAISPEQLGATLDGLSKQPEYRQMGLDSGGTIQDMLLNPAFSEAIAAKDTDAFNKAFATTPAASNPELMARINSGLV